MSSLRQNAKLRGWLRWDARVAHFQVFSDIWITRAVIASNLRRNVVEFLVRGTVSFCQHTADHSGNGIHKQRDSEKVVGRTSLFTPLNAAFVVKTTLGTTIGHALVIVPRISLRKPLLTGPIQGSLITTCCFASPVSLLAFPASGFNKPAIMVLTLLPG